MRTAAGTFGILCGVIVIVIVGRYGFKTSDNDTDGYIWAFFFGAVAFGGLFGHALGVRVWRHGRLVGALIFLVAAVALTINLSNSLGAMAGRVNQSQAKLLQIAETVRHLKRSLDRAEREREGLQFMPTDADAVSAAKAKADAATVTKDAECKKRGDRCREREADERNALEALERATLAKSVRDRAKSLDALIAETKSKIEKAGPVLDANPQGSAFARMFDLPETKAAFLSTWQNFAMAVTVEMLIVAAMIAFEVLGKEAARVSGFARKPEEVPSLSEPLPCVQGLQALPTLFKPRLIASSSEPVGNVATIMAEVIQPGGPRDKVEIAELSKAYGQACRLQAKRPVSPEEFSRAVKRLCEELGIKVTTKGERVHLMKVCLRDIEASATH